MCKMAANPLSPAVPPRAALETFLGFLESSSSATEQEALHTPHIDKVLHHYQQRVGKGEGEEVGGGRVGGDSSSSPVYWAGGGYESRLMQLERQLSLLLRKSKRTCKRSSGSSQAHPGSPSSMSSEPSDNETVPHSSKTVQTHPPGKTTVRSRAMPTRPRPSPPPPLRAKKGSELGKRSRGEGREKENVPRSKREGGKGQKQGGGRKEGMGVSTVQEDRQHKTQLLMETRREMEASQTHASMQIIAQELEGERMRRSKAEEAASRLVEHVRSLQKQLQEAGRERELAVARAAQLEGELRGERERAGKVQEETKKMEESLTAVHSELEVVRRSAGEQEAALRAMEEEGRKREASHLRERTELMSRVHEAELSSSAHQREVGVVRGSVAEMKQQLQQMQELLAAREREHQKAMKHCKPLDSREVQELVSQGAERERERAERLVEQYKQRVAEQQKAYQALEDEFRMALRIEASRYQELQQCYTGVQGEVDGLRSATESALKKEHRATQMVAELTAIVREQKGRLAELSQAKKETVTELRERVSELEADVKDKHKVEVKVQSLQEDNSQLSAQLSAQESVLEGLREERQLWSRELAQQGAGLARDRGRMEAQIEALSQETASLTEELQNTRDSLRVKEKVVADQQSTIGQLREALTGREREGQEARLDWEQEQQSLQLQLEQEEEASQQLQEQLSAVLERKEQLKEELSAVREEVDQWKSKHSKLWGQWEERVKVIGSLEQSLAQVQETFSQREAVLVREREQATQRAREAEERWTASEEAHRKQLEAQKRSHDSHMTQLVQQKNREIEEANHKVAVVEGEMRELLSEVSRERRAMEGRVQKLSLALQELQQDIT